MQARHDSSAIKGCTIYLDNGKRQATTDSQGKFVFTNLPNGQYILHASTADFKATKQTVILAGRDLSVLIQLVSRQETLAEVTVTDKQSDFGFTGCGALKVWVFTRARNRK